MYAEFFGLRELPFSNTPDPRFFFSTPDHEEALASLVYAVQERKGFVLLTGEVGAGKTLLSRMMLRHFGTGISFAGIHHAVQGAGDLLEALCSEFELEIEPTTSHNKLVRTLHDFLLSEFSKDRPVVLVLDEAQALSVDAFEQLRMLGNLEADDAKLLQIVILGQPELQQRFASREFRQLSQRIFRTFHLPALTRELTEAYIRHRLTVAGAPHTDVFDRQAIDKIYQHSTGLPRLINTICDNAMLSGYSADCRRLDDAFIESTVAHMLSLNGGEAYGPIGQISVPAATVSRGATTRDLRPAIDTAAPPESQSHALIQGLHQRLSQLESRLTGVSDTRTALIGTDESAAAGAASEISHASRQCMTQAQEATSRLEKLLEQTGDAAHTLQMERERCSAESVRMTRMASTSRAIVSEVRRVFGGLRRAAAKAQLAERRVERICERLEKAAKTASAFTGARRALEEPTGDVPPHAAREPTLIRQRSMPRDDLSPQPTAVSTWRSMPEMLGALQESQSSVAALKALVRAEKDERIVEDAVERQLAEGADADSLLQPTARLTGQVYTLLDIVSAGTG